jgi:hypothetical protein
VNEITEPCNCRCHRTTDCKCRSHDKDRHSLNLLYLNHSQKLIKSE